MPVGVIGCLSYAALGSGLGKVVIVVTWFVKLSIVAGVPSSMVPKSSLWSVMACWAIVFGLVASLS